MKSADQNEALIKVSLTDDHPLVLEGIEKVLATIADVEVVGRYSRGQELLNDIALNRPDVLFLDLQLPDISGRELSRKLLKAYPDLKILMCTLIV